MKTKKFHLIIFGCQMNYSDAERLAAVLKQLGYQETDDESQADLIGVIACSVRQAAADRMYGKLRNWQLVKEKRPLITLLSGCVLDRDKKKLQDKFDLFIDIKQLHNLADDLQNIKPQQKLALPDFFDIQPDYQSNYRAYVPIMTGCNKFCSYCVVPYTRGRETSRPAKHIIKEVEGLLQQGYKEIVLLGQNVNSYGRDIKGEINFPDLLKKIDTLGDNFWLKFLTSHPYDMSDKLIKVMSECKNLNDYLHLPVQAGSNKILKKMNRHYTVAHYKKLIKKIRQAMPDITISTDIIVGFCSETKKDFQATAKLFTDIKYNMAYISQYSARTGTAATKLYKDDVTKAEKKLRWQKLDSLLSKQSAAFNKKLLGQTREVLIDVVKKTEGGYLNIGKLSNYIAAHTKTKQPLKVGEFYKVKLIKTMHWGYKAELYKKPKIAVVLGPTAAGKSDLAVELAKKFNGEILSSDSRQIYKGMDIASNKITKQEMQGIPHHLLDIVRPNQEFNLYNWQQTAFKTIEKIVIKGKLPIIAGGTGLYICSIIQNYDLHPTNPQLRECPYDFIVFGIDPNREKLYKKINTRVERMVDDGSIDEVKKIYKKYPNKKLPALSGIGYREIIEYLDKKINLEKAIDKIKQNTRHYAKRQLTWFRRMEKQGVKIHWNKGPATANKLLKQFLNK
ncbi:tRNA (N6-isopentenyl adenosine(37)-C2)-methylthiotransferase MiaB [Candidatus Parcubacteria bacterium]|jgi:tRNA-2-methylthio-N6-dimethylallyladenosine synthase|nr:tRNA (N6-isopentenyl adenosine(37)-C2)-methylthiotransferase MiaB [Candidatus Parcubacteria bacterium]